MSTKLPDPAIDTMPTPAEMLDAYLSSGRRIVELARTLSPVQWDISSPATPAWTVRGVVSHVTSVAFHSATGTPWGEDLQATIDGDVEQRAHTPLPEIGEELAGHLDALEVKLAGRGPSPLVVDMVTHEHDIRLALGPDYRDHGAGMPQALSAMVEWVRGLGLVEEPGIRFTTPTSRVEFGGPEIGCEVDVADDWELFRLLGVRRSEEQLRALEPRGDIGLLFKITSRYPLPEAPLESNG